MEPILALIRRHGQDPGGLLDVIREVQAAAGRVPPEAVEEIARHLGLSAAEVEGAVSFYHFFSLSPRGRYTVYLNDAITSVLAGRAAAARGFEAEAGCRFGETSPDGLITLLPTSCIGMNDQEPAALIGGVVFTRLTEAGAREIVRGLRAGRSPRDLVAERGDGLNQSELVRAMVRNNIRLPGPVLFAPWTPGEAVRKAAAMTPEGVIQEIKSANLLGRGGAGFPTGLKWEFCRREPSDVRYVVANADEGEPGTFKDRVLLTERAPLVFEGMAVAGYASGAREGLLYLRSEYDYLRPHLEKTLGDMRSIGLLGRSISGRPGFDFDVRIVSGAGAYVCGEESALLNSAEGKRGEPRDRPPFPVQKGYRGKPTTVNNPETLGAAARILARGADWFRSMGTIKSTGTKLLSVSGDCERPGVYEVEFGLPISRLLEMAGAAGAAFVQVGGPSGCCVGPDGFARGICYEDAPTGGSVMIFGPGRDLFAIVRNFMDFFIEESCGWCVPCRAGNPLLLRKFEKIVAGRGTRRDLDEIEAWGKIVKATSRCGLGQTSPNPILTSLQSFRGLYESRLRKDGDSVTEVDIDAAVRAGCEAAGRPLTGEEIAHG